MSVSIKALMKPGDVHFVVNGQARTATCFDHTGRPLFKFAARTDGQHDNWREPNGDTPPGLYKCGVIYDTHGEAAYGNWCIDLIDLEGQETGNGRAGISMHGGGTGLRDPFAPWQGWMATHGCVRTQNEDLNSRIVPEVRSVQRFGHVAYVTVIL